MSSLKDVVFSPAGLSGKVYSVEEVDDAAYHHFEQSKLRVDTIDEQTAPVVVSANQVLIASHPTKNSWTPYLIYCLFSAVIGSAFCFGYNAVVINEPAGILQAFIAESFIAHYHDIPAASVLSNLWTWTVSLFLAGGMVGAFLGGLEADKFGRKLALMMNSIIGVVSGIMMVISPLEGVNSFELLMAGRFIAGIHCGSVSAIVPAYLTELAPLSLRGAAGTLNQLSLVCGGFSAAILGLPVLLAQINIYQYLFLPCAVLPAVQLVLLYFSVESPRWLVMVKRDEVQAFIATARLREHHLPREIIEAEVQQLRREREIQEGLPTLSFFQSLSGAFGWPMIICIAMQLAQQLSGINAAIYYSSTIFSTIFPHSDIPSYASLGVVGTTVVGTIVSIFIVERVGRRILMIGGLAGMWVCCIFIVTFMALSDQVDALNYGTIAFMFIFVFSFAIGPGPIPWFIAPELSLPMHRPVVIAVCTFANWSANLAVGLFFPPLEDAAGPYSFLLFFGILTLATSYAFIFLPETKGRAAEDTVHRLQLRKIQLSFGPFRPPPDFDRAQSAVSSVSGL